MKPLLRTLLILAVCLALALPANPARAQSSDVPTFAIIAVTPGVNVTIQATNFPAQTAFDAYMGPESTKAVDGKLAGSVTSGPGGTFTATFRIPPELAKEYQVGLRLQATSASDYYVYNWFYNNRSTAPNYSASSARPSGTSAVARPVPTFVVSGVKADQSVTITTYHFPANDRFEVLMGYLGTRGLDGISAGVIDTGKGGTQTYIFPIPQALFGQYAIAIRLQSITGSGYYSYNWFNNRATYVPQPGPGIPGYPGTGGLPGYGNLPGYGSFPTFSIVTVFRDQSVTIQAYNLPAEKNFRVRMGPMGTRGYGGLIVASFNTGEGGMQTLAFNLPAGLYGLPQIAIRIEATDLSGYYAYNWFYNR